VAQLESYLVMFNFAYKCIIIYWSKSNSRIWIEFLSFRASYQCNHRGI